MHQLYIRMEDSSKVLGSDTSDVGSLVVQRDGLSCDDHRGLVQFPFPSFHFNVQLCFGVLYCFFDFLLNYVSVLIILFLYECSDLDVLAFCQFISFVGQLFYGLLFVLVVPHFKNLSVLLHQHGSLVSISQYQNFSFEVGFIDQRHNSRVYVTDSLKHQSTGLVVGAKSNISCDVVDEQRVVVAKVVELVVVLKSEVAS